MKVYEALARALVEEGVDTAFTLMDEFNMDLVLELGEKLGMRIVTARHEEGAVLMADGYARVTGRPALAIIGAGPAIAHTGTGLVTMRLRQSPVLVLAADTARNDLHNAKVFDNRRYAEATVGTFIPLRDAATLVEDLGRAFRHLRAGAGPVVLNVPGDVFQSSLGTRWHYDAPAATLVSQQRTRAAPEIVAQAASTLAAAQRPVIIVGRGAVASGARQAIAELAKRIGALLACSLRARGYFDADPYFLGIAGGFSTPSALQLIGEADCVVSVGAGLNWYTTRGGTLFPEARLIQIDSDPSRIGALLRPDVAMVGDALATVSAINEGLECEGIRDGGGFRSDEAGQSIRASWSYKTGPFVDTPGILDPYQVVAELDELLPAQRTVVCEGGHYCLFTATGMAVPEPSAFLFGNDFAAMSVGLGISIGAALGRPERHCILFVGDGGLMMSLPELETAARHRIPLTVVVMNDGAYGAEFHKLRAAGKSVELTLFDNPQFEDVARALGCTGATARSVDELRSAAATAGTLDHPLVIDTKITREVMHWAMKEYL